MFGNLENCFISDALLGKFLVNNENAQFGSMPQYYKNSQMQKTTIIEIDRSELIHDIETTKDDVFNHIAYSLSSNLLRFTKIGV